MSGERALKDVDIIVLAGGLGTRVSHILGDVPKLLAPIDGKPFLGHLLDWLVGFGATRVLLSLGVRSERVLEYLAGHGRASMTLVPLVEPSPLGTAGAVRFALPHTTSDTVFILNGDTFLEADLNRFVANHRQASSYLSLLCAEVPSVARFGSVEVVDGHIARFIEKDGAADHPGLISAGMYLFSRAAIDALQRSNGASLERDFLQILPAGSIRAEITHGRFIDIGTPQSLAEAPHLVPAMAQARNPQ